jgi:acetolactate synthase regulatory subunit
MTTALPIYPQTSAAGGQVELAFALELDSKSPTALLRIVALLHRRRCRVTEIEYRSRVDGRDHLDLRVHAPRAHAHCLAAWLSALLDVRHVIERHHAAPPT